MARGKRRCSQRTNNASKKVRNNETTDTQSAVEQTVSVSKKKKTAPLLTSSPSREGRSDLDPVRPSLPPPHNASQEVIPGALGGARLVPRVLTPPQSRVVSRRGAETHSPITPPASKPVATGMRLSDSSPGIIPESSEDCEVYHVPRVPFHENTFYKRYFDMDPADMMRRAGVRNGGSPVTPGLSPQAYRSGNLEDEDMDEAEAVISSRRVSDEVALGRITPTGQSPSTVVRDMQGMSITREMLSSFHKGIESMLVKGFEDIRQLFCSRLDRFEESHGKLATEVNELRVIASAGKQGAGFQSRSTPLARYELKLENSTPYAEWVFDVDTICKTLRMNLPHAVITIASETGAVVDNVSIALRAILFGLQPSQRRAAFSSGVGRRHSAFRFSVVMNVLCNVQQNSFNRFIRNGTGNGAGAPNPDAQDVEESDEGPVVPLPAGVMQIRQPKWLEPRFIRRRHVEDARQRVESNAASQENGTQQNLGGQRAKRVWLTVKETPDKADIARFGALKVYRFVTTGLYYGREKAKWVLFEELMYLMIPWDAPACDVDQRTLRMVWGHDCPETDGIEIGDAPLCRKRGDKPGQADEHNTALMAEFLSARKEMLVCVSHSVKIKTAGNSVRHTREGEERVLHRSINLIDVATKFCVVFTEQAMGGFSMLPFLGAHVDSMKCIYAVAVLFRRVVERFMQEHIEDNAYIAPEEEDPPQLECNGLKFETLLPAASVRKRLLTGRCLRMTAEDFDKLNFVNPAAAPGSDVTGDGEDGDDDIVPLGADGVMLL